MHKSQSVITSFSDVTKSYKGSQVLDCFSLDLCKGDFVSIIGPSGCGKTTLLRLAAGLIGPESGKITFDKSQDSSAYIFQEPTLLPWRTALGNIELPLKLAGLRASECHQRALDLLDLVGLSDAADKFPRQLSGGMMMRVSLARALAGKPSLLLLDEPFGALDAMTRNRLNEELLALRESQPFTALFVTHSVSEAVFLSNNILVMAGNPGQIISRESIDFPYPRTRALREEPAFYKEVARLTALLSDVEGGIV